MVGDDTEDLSEANAARDERAMITLEDGERAEIRNESGIVTIKKFEDLIPEIPEPAVGIMHSFCGADGVDNWTGQLNFPSPEREHNRMDVKAPDEPIFSSGVSMRIEIKPGDPQWSVDAQGVNKTKRRAEFSWRDWRF